MTSTQTEKKGYQGAQRTNKQRQHYVYDFALLQSTWYVSFDILARLAFHSSVNVLFIALPPPFPFPPGQRRKGASWVRPLGAMPCKMTTSVYTQLYLHTINSQMYDQTFIEYSLFTYLFIYVQNIFVIVYSQL